PFRKDANAALLSNFEVYQLLTDLKQQRKESGKTKQSSGQQNLNTIMYEVSTRAIVCVLGNCTSSTMSGRQLKALCLCLPE
uniref:DNA-directed RNA polymerase III subunit RPC9 n=1 Tax=Cyanoderma ruficeps TaxID=181631 RepID=A0A8C3QFB9_9PASS